MKRKCPPLTLLALERYNDPTIRAAPVLSVPPESLESVVRQLRVAHGVSDVPMSEPKLNAPRVVPGLDESVTAGVPELVWVDGKAELRAKRRGAIDRQRA